MSLPNVGVFPVISTEFLKDMGVIPKAQTLAARHAQAVKQSIEALPGNDEEPKSHMLYSAAADLESVSLTFNKKLRFVVDHRSNEVIVKVIDRETDKVIKELPPEELQRLHSKVKEAIGFMFDEWA